MTDRLQEIRERLDSWHQKSDSIASKKDRIDGDPILLAALLSGSLYIRDAASDIRWLLERVEELEEHLELSREESAKWEENYREAVNPGSQNIVEFGFTAKKSPSVVIRPEGSND